MLFIFPGLPPPIHASKSTSVSPDLTAVIPASKSTSVSPDLTTARLKRQPGILAGYCVIQDMAVVTPDTLLVSNILLCTTSGQQEMGGMSVRSTARRQTRDLLSD